MTCSKKLYRLTRAETFLAVVEKRLSLFPARNVNEKNQKIIFQRLELQKATSFSTIELSFTNIFSQVSESWVVLRAVYKQRPNNNFGIFGPRIDKMFSQVFSIYY